MKQQTLTEKTKQSNQREVTLKNVKNLIKQRNYSEGNCPLGDSDLVQTVTGAFIDFRSRINQEFFYRSRNVHKTCIEAK